MVSALMREGEEQRNQRSNHGDDQQAGPPRGNNLRCGKRCRKRTRAVMSELVVSAGFSVMFVSGMFVSR